jgi:hypothetical protein
MAEVSVQLHSCLNTMKAMSREKRDIIITSQQDIFELKKKYEALGITIAEKEEGLATETSELETLNVHIKETQQQYKKILDSTHDLMRQVKEYNPTKVEKAENIIEKTLDDLKKSHQEIQMTNFTIAKNKHDSDSKLTNITLNDNKDLNDHDTTENNCELNNGDTTNVEEPPKQPDKRKNKFSNKLKNMQKDVRGKNSKSQELQSNLESSDDQISLMIE